MRWAWLAPAAQGRQRQQAQQPPNTVAQLAQHSALHTEQLRPMCVPPQPQHSTWASAAKVIGRWYLGGPIICANHMYYDNKKSCCETSRARGGRGGPGTSCSQPSSPFHQRKEEGGSVYTGVESARPRGWTTVRGRCIRRQLPPLAHLEDFVMARGMHSLPHDHPSPSVSMWHISHG